MEKTKNKTMKLLSNCAVCGSKKSTFVKDQEAIGILRILGLKIPLTKISLVGPILFYWYEINKMINKV